MTSIDELHTAIVDTHARFGEAVAGLDVEVLETEPALGYWSVREIAGHIGAWNHLILDVAEDVAMSRTSQREAIRDFDGFNAQSAERTRQQRWEEVIADLDATIDRATTLTRRLTPADLENPASFPWGGSGNLLQLFHGIDGHEDEHIADVVAWRARRDISQ